MKLISKENLSKGSCLANSWISFGKMHNHHITDITRYLYIRIPLFILKWDMDLSFNYDRFGWYIPKLLIQFGKNIIRFRIVHVFHSDFMNEPLYKDIVTGEELSDPWDYSKFIKDRL